MSVLVVDASVVLKWVIPEILSHESERLLLDERILISPDIMPVEVGSVLCRKVRKKELSAEKALAAMANIEKAGVQLLPSRPFLAEGMPAALKYGQGLFDMIYLVAASMYGGIFVTADRRFVNAMAGTPWAPFVHWVGGPLKT